MATPYFHFVAHSNGQMFIRHCNMTDFSSVCNHFRLTHCHEFPNLQTGALTRVHSRQPPFEEGGLTQFAVVGLGTVSEDDARAIIDHMRDDRCRVRSWLLDVVGDGAQRRYAGGDHPFANLERKCSGH